LKSISDATTNAINSNIRLIDKEKIKSVIIRKIVTGFLNHGDLIIYEEAPAPIIFYEVPDNDIKQWRRPSIKIKRYAITI